MTLYGPPLSPPSQVYSHRATNQTNKFVVSWARVPGAVNYDVVLSPDSTFVNETCDVKFDKVSSTTYTIDAYDLSSGCAGIQDYSVGVRANVKSSTSELIFKSAFSRAGKFVRKQNESRA